MKISRYNELCAQFLGFENLTPTIPVFNIWGHKEGVMFFDKVYSTLETMSMLFDEDWNWIMKVVDKIYHTKAYYEDYITRDPNPLINRKLQLSTNKEDVVHSIYNFLVWYYDEYSKV